MKKKSLRFVTIVVIVAMFSFVIGKKESSADEIDRIDFPIESSQNITGTLPVQDIFVHKYFEKTLTLQDANNGGSGIKNNVQVSLVGALAPFISYTIRYSDEIVSETNYRYAYVDIGGTVPIEGSVDVYLAYEDGAGNAVTYILPIQSTFLKASPITIEYVDDEGTEISGSQIMNGNFGETYDASTTQYKLTIDGYTLDESKLPSNMTGKMGDIPQTVTYVYHKTIQIAKEVVVKYVNEIGKDINEPKVIHGEFGERYDVSTNQYKLVIDGYTLDESKLPDNVKGTISDSVQIITYVYNKISVEAKEVIVKYVDVEGTEIRNPQAIYGKVGEYYNTTTDQYKLTIAGYTLDSTKLPDNAVGLINSTVQTVTYVYQKDEITQLNLTNPAIKTGVTTNTKTPTAISFAHKNNLPSTGENKNPTQHLVRNVALFFILNALGLWNYYSKKKSH